MLVDFWAPWCAPCRAIAPIVEELSREYDGKLKVVKMNVDDNPKTPSQYGVRGIPNLLLIQGGQVKEQIVGAHAQGAARQARSDRRRRAREPRGSEPAQNRFRRIDTFITSPIADQQARAATSRRS